jgi:sugar phosphate isomerase/epimerase
LLPNRVRPIGQGSVNYPEFIKKLKGIGYDRYITIEREIAGDEQKADIRAAKKLLEELWARE